MYKWSLQVGGGEDCPNLVAGIAILVAIVAFAIIFADHTTGQEGPVQ
jgi:hypothetical protein